MPDNNHTPLVPLPPDDPLRRTLHDEVHARPPARIRMPALVVYVAVLNDGITREAECRHLRRLPGQHALPLEAMQGNFLRLRLDGFSVKWERHTEFTRYSVVQPLPEGFWTGPDEWPLAGVVAVDVEWLRTIPGRTFAAIELMMVPHAIDDAQAVLERARRGFGDRAVVASLTGGGHACAITDFRLEPSGFERMLIVAPPDTSPTRAGRASQRLLEIETYRLMALRGLPVAKSLSAMLQQTEDALAAITARLEDAAASDRELLDRLTEIAVRVERATAEHGFRFSATQAYDALVRQRIAELREQPIPGTQTIGEFMQRRLSPAIATVMSTAQRLASLSQRIERAGALLRTRVDIATEAQNHELLAKLTRGQQMQLRLQSTVEGLSIAAISYYVVSLVLYGAKAAASAGLRIEPELVAGLSIPIVLFGAWRTVRHIHRKLYQAS